MTIQADAGEAGFPDIPGIDRRRAERRLGGNRALFLLGLRDLRDDFTDLGPRTRADLASGAVDHAIARAHRLRGCAANLGAEALAALAADLERELRGRGSGSPENALARLERALGQLVAALPADVDEPAAGAPAASVAVIAAADIDALIAALAQHEMDAVERFHALQPGLAARHGAAAVARLGDAVNRLQFGIAAAQLRAWYEPKRGGAG